MKLQNMFHALSQQLYAQDQKPPQGGPGPDGQGPQTPPSSGGKDGDVIEGEVRDA